MSREERINELEAKLEKLGPTMFERSLAVVSPRLAVKRMADRHKLLEFEWRASRPGKRRGNGGGRSTNSTTQSPRSQMSRVKLMWEARKGFRDIPIMACVVNRLAEYTVPQVMYQANTGDDKLDDAYEAYWKNWATYEADMTGRTDLDGLVKLGFMHMLIDGDFFFRPFHTEKSYALQCIEGDRIGNPDQAGNEVKRNQIAGVTIGDTGEPVSYAVYNRDKHARYEKADDVPAEEMLPFMSLDTADQVRGVSLFCRVIDQINDLYETFEFERGAAKWAASYAGIVYEKDSRNPRGGGASEFDGVTKEGTPTQSVIPNKLLRLVEGESVASFPPSNRPSGAFMALIDATIRDIAMGVDLPFGFFDMRGFGGATSRLEAHQIQRKISAWQNLIKRSVLNPLRDRVFTKAIHTGQLRPPPRGLQGTWTFGPHITADLGYQTNADIMLLQHNLTSGKKLAAAQGFDYDELIEERGTEIQKLYTVAQNKQIPVEMLNPNFSNASNLFADLIAAQSPAPKIKPTIQDAGDKVAKQILELINSVAEGTLPRDEAINLLVYTYQMPRQKAETIVPKQGEAKTSDSTDNSHQGK